MTMFSDPLEFDSEGVVLERAPQQVATDDDAPVTADACPPQATARGARSNS